MFELDIVRLLKGTGLNDMRLVGILQDVTFVLVIAEKSAIDLLSVDSIFTGEARLMDTLMMSKLFPFSSWTGRITGLGVGMTADTLRISLDEMCVWSGTKVDNPDLEIQDDIEAVDETMLDGTIVTLQDCGDVGGVVHIL